MPYRDVGNLAHDWGPEDLLGKYGPNRHAALDVSHFSITSTYLILQQLSVSRSMQSDCQSAHIESVTDRTYGKVQVGWP
jgi:hypothetical protein